MRDLILDAFNSRNYQRAIELINSIGREYLDHELTVVYAHSLRMLGEFSKAVKTYEKALKINPKDKRSAYHGLNLINSKHVDIDIDIDIDVFISSVLTYGDLSFDEAFSVLKYILISGKDVSSVECLINKLSFKYKLAYSLLDDVGDSSPMIAYLFEDFFAFRESFLDLSSLDPLDLSEKLYAILALDKYISDGLQENDLQFMIRSVNNKGVDLPLEYCSLSLLTNFYQLNREYVELFLSFLNPSAMYPLIINGYQVGRINSEAFKYYTSQLKRRAAKYCKNERNNSTVNQVSKLLIVAPAFLSANSSYVKFIRDYISSILSVKNDVDFKILVTDELNINILGFSFGYKSSSVFREKHFDLLEKDFSELEASIDIYYAEGPGRDDFIVDAMNVIDGFSPDCVLSFSAYGSLFFSEYIYENYPFVYFQTNVKDSPNYNADVYLTFYDDVGFVSNSKVHPDRWFQQKSPYIPLLREREITREEYLGKFFDIVFVTVGARLGVELNKEFSQGILSIIRKYKLKGISVCWLVVGKFDRFEFIRLATEADALDCIVFKDYESNLASAYSVCDIYLNPPRTGGGISIAYAINEGVPAICFDGADASPFVGKDMLFGSLTAYCEKLESFIIRKEELYLEQRQQKSLLDNNHSPAVVGQGVMKHIEHAIKKYNSRM